MKTHGSINIRKLCVLAGVCLIVCAIAVLALWQWNINSSSQLSQYYTNTLLTLIPDVQNAVPEERRDNTLPTLSVNGTDFVGIIEMPKYSCALPVCANWGKTSSYPCLFDGSIYDSSLQIGATTQKGHYEFYRELSVGDTVYFTDMEGNRYSLEITSLRYETHANKTTLTRENAALTLFVKNIYSFEYLIVSCNIAK